MTPLAIIARDLLLLSCVFVYTTTAFDRARRLRSLSLPCSAPHYPYYCGTIAQRLIRPPAHASPLSSFFSISSSLSRDHCRDIDSGEGFSALGSVSSTSQVEGERIHQVFRRRGYFRKSDNAACRRSADRCIQRECKGGRHFLGNMRKICIGKRRYSLSKSNADRWITDAQ